MAAETQKEPGTLAYEWSLSADRVRCRLYEAYVDAGAVLAHLKGPVVQELVPKLLEAEASPARRSSATQGPRPPRCSTAMGAQIFPVWQGFS